MELGVFGNSALPSAQFLLLPFEDLFHLRNFVGRNTRRGPGSQRRFEHLAKVKQLADPFFFALEGVGKRIHQRVGGNLANDGASTLTRFDHAHQLEAPNRVSYGASAYNKHFRQFAFGRKFIAGPQFFQNQTFDLLGNSFVNFIPADSLEIGFEG